MPSRKRFKELRHIKDGPRRLAQKIPSPLVICLAKTPFPLPGPKTESFGHDERIYSEVRGDRNRPVLPLQTLIGTVRQTAVTPL